MKEQKTIFTCDKSGCGKDTEWLKGFPYDQGWVYIYNAQIKVNKDRQIRMMDRHYCSQSHMLEDIKEKMERPRNEIK